METKRKAQQRKRGGEGGAYMSSAEWRQEDRRGDDTNSLAKIAAHVRIIYEPISAAIQTSMHRRRYEDFLHFLCQIRQFVKTAHPGQLLTY